MARDRGASNGKEEDNGEEMCSAAGAGGKR